MKTKDKKSAPNPDGSMSLSGHLKELRNRILICVILLVAMFALCLSFAPQIVTALTDMGEKYDYVYVYIAPQELFLVYMNVALIGALVVCFPVLAYQVYAFCSPGLSSKERVYISGALIAGGLCFLAGVAFAYFIMLRFLIQFTGQVDVAASISIQSYVSFLLTVFVIFGLVFELPVVSVLLTGLGLVKAEWLVKGRKVMVVLIFVLAAIITPPDVVSQIMVAVPMIGLYELSIVLCRVFARKEQSAQ